MVEENRPPPIDFSLIPENYGNENNPEREGKLVGNKGELQQILNLTDEAEWTEWLRSRLVQPWWIELWTECLSKRASGERGVGVGEIQAKILAGEGNGRNEYSDPVPEKKEWSAADHIARFHFMVKTRNLVSNEGVFYGKNFADSYLDKVVWGLKGYLNKIHTPSHINKPTGGAAIFGEWVLDAKRKRTDSSYTAQPSKLKRTESGKANNGSETESEERNENGASNGNEPEEAETTQATESEEGVACQEVDAANEDENASGDDNGEPLPLDSDLWKNELLSPRKQIVLKKQSTDFNREEAYWQFVLITEALACTRIVEPADNAPAAVDDDPSSTVNTVWEPPAILPGSKKSQLATETFESSYYADAADLESSYAGEIDSTKESSGVIIPTEDSIARLQDLKKIIDNKDYQRDDHEQACHFLGIRNPAVPRLLYMNRAAVLKHWQPVAIAGIVRMREVDYLRGGVLGDHVGLGKTWEAVGVLLYLLADYRQKVKEASESGTSVLKAYPFLIVVPPSLIMQWAAEVTSITKELTVQLYYGDSRGSTEIGVPQINRRLKQEDKLFNGEPENARIVVLTTYQTLNQRHGPAAVKSWCQSTNQRYYDNATRPPSDFPFNIQECFHDVVLDEAHSLRNPMSSQTRAVYWLAASFHLLLSATLLYNSRDDMRGYMPLLFTTPSIWGHTDWTTLGVSTEQNVFELPEDHPGAKLRCSVEAVEKYVLNQQVAPDVSGDRFRLVLKRLMIRRNLTSRIPFDSPMPIGADIPPIERKVINVIFSKPEDEMFSDLASNLRKGLFTRSPADRNKFIYNMRKLRMLMLLSSWLGMHYVESSLEAQNIPVVVSKLKTREVAPFMAKAIEEMVVVNKTAMAHFFKHASSLTNQRRTWCLEFLLRGSPKMRAMLPILRDQVIIHGEKAIVWTQFPAEQVYVAATLVEANFNARVFHAGLSVHERSVLIKQFTQDPTSCSVLICSYGVNAMGLNLQNLCRNVHLFSPGMSKAVVDQAIGRVCRLGQTRIVLVYEYQLENKFNAMLVKRNKLKAVPGLVAEMSPDEFSMALDIGRWVVRGGEAYRLGNDEAPTVDDKTDSSAVLEALLVLLA